MQMVPPRPERENSEREWHAVSSNAAGSSAEAGCSELTTADDADANAMHAMATLSQQLHRAATCTGPPGLALHVHVALQATADSLVSGQLCAKSSGRVRLACQAWLEWVLIDTSSQTTANDYELDVRLSMGNDATAEHAIIFHQNLEIQRLTKERAFL